MIFPEGSTTNGLSIIQFKKGSFAPLRPVTPIVFNYNSANVKVCQDVVGFKMIFMYGVCGIITTKVHRLPVFAPNDYFWKHHWQEGKEEKWETFARVIRQIMSEAGGLKLSDL